MKLEEAFQELRNHGKEIRHPSFNEDQYIVRCYTHHDGLINFLIKSIKNIGGYGGTGKYSIPINILLSEDWEIF